jgi:hypothetical protein
MRTGGEIDVPLPPPPRYGSACSGERTRERGHLFQRAATGGPDKPGHDGKGAGRDGGEAAHDGRGAGMTTEWTGVNVVAGWC